jgi:DNA-binding FrmR family transcriptional regulator
MAETSDVKKQSDVDQHIHVHRKTKAVSNRLSRIEGHVRSIKTMVEDQRDCTEILIQIAAVRSAINKVGKVVLEDHLESCLFHEGVSPEDNDIWLSVKDVFDAYF